VEFAAAIHSCDEELSLVALLDDSSVPPPLVLVAAAPAGGPRARALPHAAAAGGPRAVVFPTIFLERKAVGREGAVGGGGGGGALKGRCVKLNKKSFPRQN